MLVRGRFPSILNRNLVFSLKKKSFFIYKGMAFFFSLLPLLLMTTVSWTMLLFAGFCSLELVFLDCAENRACHNCIFLWNLLYNTSYSSPPTLWSRLLVPVRWQVTVNVLGSLMPWGKPLQVFLAPALAMGAAGVGPMQASTHSSLVWRKGYCISLIVFFKKFIFSAVSLILFSCHLC